MTIKIQLSDFDPQGDLDPLGKEREWSTNVVSLLREEPRSDSVITVSPPKQASAGATSAEASLATGPDERYRYVLTQRKGPHTKDIEWTSFKVDPPASQFVKTDDPPLKVQVGARARVSAWTAGSRLWSILDHPEVLSLGPSPGKPLTPAQLKAVREFKGIDDVTLTQTIINKAADSDDVVWADNFLKADGKGGNEATFLKKVIKYLHERKVQVFVGFFIDTGVADLDLTYGDIFVKWLRAKPMPKDPDDLSQNPFRDHATKLVKFFDDQGLDIDGLSYDLEVGGKPESKKANTSLPSPVLGPADLDRLKLLFQAVANELRRRGRYLAYATVGFRQPPSQAVNHHMVAQPFSLARSIPDVIARGMTYTEGDKGREAVIKYALGAEGLHPGQLQIGMATVKVGALVFENGKPVNKVFVPSTFQDVQQEQSKFERRYRVGFIHWYLNSIDDVAAYAAVDKALNPNGPERGTAGQPLQGPLGDDRLNAFAEAGAPDVIAYPGTNEPASKD